MSSLQETFPPLFSGLRVRLVLLVAVALLPALGLILYQGFEQRQHAREQAAAQALSLARLVSQTQAGAIEGSRPLLVTLAQLFASTGRPISELGSEQCDRFLSAVRHEAFLYANIGVAAADGAVVCSAVPLAGSVNISDRAYFQGAIETRGFHIGEYQIGRITGVSTVNTGFPVLDQTGQVQGVVYVAVDLGQVSALAATADLPPGAVVDVIDRNGTFLMRHPDPEDWIGQSLPDAPVVRALLQTSGPGTTQAAGLDGVERLFGFAPLLEAPGEESPVVGVGIPVATAFEPVTAALIRNVVGLVLATGLIMAMAWVIADLLVLRGIRSLVGATQRLAEGDLSARSGSAHDAGEIGQLAQSFDAMAASLQQRQAEVETLNAELEQRVVERTVQLEATNRELEAFTYSVSHDLRAPLRGMNGFSEALLRNHADRLDPKGVDYLERIRRASQFMGQLIDNLLKLSRLTRAELHSQEVDLSAMARGIAEELIQEAPERTVEVKVADGLVAQGDPVLLDAVLENLLANAWKFTSKHPSATIEFGTDRREGEPVYFVRDDGAGFEMAYVNKLFGPFQRLHGRNEFEGTGVGLATVQRIVHRHGGRIWAEGAVEGGATFYFTLSGGQYQTGGQNGRHEEHLAR